MPGLRRPLPGCSGLWRLGLGRLLPRCLDPGSLRRYLQNLLTRLLNLTRGLRCCQQTSLVRLMFVTLTCLWRQTRVAGSSRVSRTCCAGRELVVLPS